MPGKLLRIWRTFAQIIGTMNTYLLLSLMFIFIMIPTGLIMRLFGKTIFSRSSGSSLWIKRSGEENLDRQF